MSEFEMIEECCAEGSDAPLAWAACGCARCKPLGAAFKVVAEAQQDALRNGAPSWVRIGD